MASRPGPGVFYARMARRNADGRNDGGPGGKAEIGRTSGADGAGRQSGFAQRSQATQDHGRGSAMNSRVADEIVRRVDPKAGEDQASPLRCLRRWRRVGDGPGSLGPTRHSVGATLVVARADRTDAFPGTRARTSLAPTAHSLPARLARTLLNCGDGGASSTPVGNGGTAGLPLLRRGPHTPPGVIKAYRRRTR